MGKQRFNIPLELARFGICLMMGCLLLLFFTLMLDVVAWISYGGWNPLLGPWPIFAGTVSAAVYGGNGAVITLLISFGLLSRMVAGPVTPSILNFLARTDTAKSDETTLPEK